MNKVNNILLLLTAFTMNKLENVVPPFINSIFNQLNCVKQFCFLLKYTGVYKLLSSITDLNWHIPWFV